MINTLILSKDRAQQLDLLFQSISRFCPHLFNEIKIIYKASNEEYERGYEKLINNKKIPFCSKITWQKEKEFYSDFLLGILECNTKLICGLTDDCLFYRPINVSSSEIEKYFTDDVFCFSFRLGVNTIVQNYMTGELQPSLINDDEMIKQLSLNKIKMIKWNWKVRNQFQNFGYNPSLDGHIYHAKELYKISTHKQFTCLRQWEGELSMIIRHLTSKPMMASFPDSVLFNIPSNCVQDPPMISGTQFPYSLKELNDKYLNNEVIDLDYILTQCKQVWSSHREVEYKFKNV
jgi:hypothetical protein